MLSLRKFIIFLVYSSSFGKRSQASFVSQPSPTKSTCEEFVSNKGDLTLRDFLYKQIDYMMTVESREVPAEGRRGTHVEVKTLSWLCFHDCLTSVG